MTTCYDYRIEGAVFNGLLKPVSPSVHVRLSDRFMLLLSVCFFSGWFGWVLGGESVISIPGIQVCSAFRHDVAPVCSRFLPGNRTYKEVIRPSDKTKRPWKERRRGTIRRSLSAFRCGCFPNERKLRPCYTSHFLTVPFASLLFPIAWAAFCVQLRLPPKTVKSKYQPEN